MLNLKKLNFYLFTLNPACWIFHKINGIILIKSWCNEIWRHCHIRSLWILISKSRQPRRNYNCILHIEMILFVYCKVTLSCGETMKSRVPPPISVIWLPWRLNMDLWISIITNELHRCLGLTLPSGVLYKETRFPTSKLAMTSRHCWLVTVLL